MAQAADQPNREPWPPEGLRLRDAIERIAGAAALTEYLTARDDCRGIPLPARFVGGRQLRADEQRRIAVRDQAWRECITPVIDAWNSGALVATGCRGDPLSALVDIPPPVRGWRMIVKDLDHSIIFDPAKVAGKYIFDLRFRSASPDTKSDVPMDTKRWLAAEVERRCALGDVPGGRGAITKFSRQLEKQMAMAAKAKTVASAIGARRIETVLHETKLWPIQKPR